MVDRVPGRIVTSAPGRICLFGEHQDYLGLPVIAMAVDLRFSIEYEPAARKDFLVRTPDLKRKERILDVHAGSPAHPGDYCWGIAKALEEEGFDFPDGGRITFRSQIPIRAGCSSSSAMTAAWMRLCIEIGKHPDQEFFRTHPDFAAYLVYVGEKVKFNGAGGMMDQYSCYLGGLVYVFPVAVSEGPRKAAVTLDEKMKAIPFGVERLKTDIEGIILIDSGEPKDTQGILSAVGDRARAAFQRAKDLPGFSITKTSVKEFQEMEPGKMDVSQRQLVKDHLINRDLCTEGLAMLREGRLDAARMGAMLNEEHRILSETLGISTPSIEKARSIALAAGALGSKINGSGGGGTLFAYAPGKEAQVANALKTAGIRHFLVPSGEGARVDVS